MRVGHPARPVEDVESADLPVRRHGGLRDEHLHTRIGELRTAEVRYEREPGQPASLLARNRETAERSLAAPPGERQRRGAPERCGGENEDQERGAGGCQGGKDRGEHGAWATESADGMQRYAGCVRGRYEHERRRQIEDRDLGTVDPRAQGRGITEHPEGREQSDEPRAVPNRTPGQLPESACGDRRCPGHDAHDQDDPGNQGNRGPVRTHHGPGSLDRVHDRVKGRGGRQPEPGRTREDGPHRDERDGEDAEGRHGREKEVPPSCRDRHGAARRDRGEHREDHRMPEPTLHEPGNSQGCAEHYCEEGELGKDFGGDRSARRRGLVGFLVLPGRRYNDRLLLPVLTQAWEADSRAIGDGGHTTTTVLERLRSSGRLPAPTAEVTTILSFSVIRPLESSDLRRPRAPT